MSERAPFLNTAYSAYHHRERPAEDEELTRVGPGTPCGEYLRRFWQPVILAERIGRAAAAAAHPRRGSGRVPRQERRHRPPGTALPASRHLARIRPGRRQGHPLLLSRLAVRLRRHDPRDPGRAGRQHAEGPAVSRRLSGARTCGAGLRLYGAAGQAAAISRSSIPTTCRATGRSPARRRCGSATGCRSRKTAWTRRIWRSCTRCRAARASPTISRNWPSGTGWRRRSAWSTSTPAGRTTGCGCGSPISSCPTSTSSRPMPTRWRCATRSTGRRRRPGRCRSTTPTRCRSAITARPRARSRGAAPVSARTASGSYEERQRVPGDYDAQVSIHGGMARHGLEHLASTDRGIIMMRNMIRRGIRAVAQRRGSRTIRSCTNGAAVPTYSHDRVVPGIAPARDAGGGPAAAARGRAQRGGANGGGRLRRSINRLAPGRRLFEPETARRMHLRPP